MLIVVELDINKIYKKIFLLCLQVLEVKIYKFFKNYYNKR